MTPRAIVIGLLSAAAVCGFCFFNDFIMKQTFLVGNYMPISVYGGLLLFLLIINPLLLRMSERLAFTGKELAVIIVLTLAACYVPGRGLMHYFYTAMIMPHQYAKTTAGWKEAGVLEMAPKQMLAWVQPTYLDGDVLDGPALCSKLLDDKAAGPTRRVRDLLPDSVLATAREVAATSVVDEARKARILQAINWALCSIELFEACPDQVLALTGITRGEKETRKRYLPLRREIACYVLNRMLLHAAYPRWVTPLQDRALVLTTRDIRDWEMFCSELRGDGTRRRPSFGKGLWALLPAETQTAFGEVIEAERTSRARHAQILSALNTLIRRSDFYRKEDFQDVFLPAEGEELLKRHQKALAAQEETRPGRPREAKEAPKPLSSEERERLSRHLLDAVFGSAVRSIGASEDLAISGFVQGIGAGSEGISFADIPWHAWIRPLGFWLPLLISFSVAMIALAVVLHRQWSDHEQMPYPIVTFANALLPQEGQARGGVFRNRLFWIGCGVVVAIHLNNYACQWWPRYLVPVQLTFDFRSMTPLFPDLQRGGDYFLMNPTVWFTAVGFAYFLATDVSFSLGIAPYVYAVVVGKLAAYGVSLRGGGFLALKTETFLFGGAYFGMFLVLLYTGRHYYWNVLRHSVCLPGEEGAARETVWGARVFLLAAAAFGAQLAVVGLDWHLAILYTMGAVIIFVVISRVVSETGVFFIHAYHFPCVLLWGFLGAKALGPQAMLIMFMVTALLLIDPREAVLPFVAQGLKLADLNGVKVGKVAIWGVVALLVGFAVAVPVTLYWHYDQGTGKVTDGWTINVPKMPFDATTSAVEKLKPQGNLEDAGKQSGLAWFRSITPNSACVLAFGIAMTLVLLFSAARLRFARWPFHPVMFLVLDTWQSRNFAFSFLLGCLIKVLVTKYGGAKGYQKLKPLMIGLIAGDMLGGLIPMIIGLGYYWQTGEPPKRFLVLPT